MRFCSRGRSVPVRLNPPAQKLQRRLVKRFGKAKALSVLANKLGRAAFLHEKTSGAVRCGALLRRGPAGHDSHRTLVAT